MKIGLALSGGGARGVAHIGVIKALEELGISISIISGTSAGAIVAALYSYGHSPDDILGIIKKVKLFRAVRPAWSWSTGLLKMDGLQELLLHFIPDNKFSSLRIPAVFAATELRLGETHYFSEGELVPAVLASCTVPGIFSPYVYRDGLYVDGGLLDNLPVKALVGKCDFIVGSHCNNYLTTYSGGSLKMVIERSLLMAINTNTQISKQLCDLVIEPPGLATYSGLDIAKAQEIFDFAYKFTKDNFNRKSFERATE